MIVAADVRRRTFANSQFIRLSRNHREKPKLKNSKTQISEFMSFGLPRHMSRKMPFLVSDDKDLSGFFDVCNGYQA